MNPLVTIGIATYNRLHYLKEAVASALAQTYPDIEILISQNPYHDEAVTRSIAEWCREMVAQHPRIRYRCNPRNLGSPANFNAIGDAAAGEYLGFIGDDDRLEPQFTATMLAAIQSGYELAFCNHYRMDKDGRRLVPESYQWTKGFRRDRLAAGEVDARMVAWQRTPFFFACLMRTRDFRRIRFVETIGTPDSLFFIHLAEQGARFTFVPEYLTEIRVHDATATAAGLRIEQWVPYLLPIPVPVEFEPHKRALVSPLILRAVSRHLVDGELAAARGYTRSEYYPRRHHKALFQRLCLRLPEPVGYRLFRAVYLTKRRGEYRTSRGAHEFSLFPPSGTDSAPPRT